MKKKESHNVEFKREWKDDSLKAVCGFANSTRTKRNQILKKGMV